MFTVVPGLELNGSAENSILPLAWSISSR